MKYSIWLAAAAVIATLPPAMAQDSPAPSVLTLDAALELLPDHTRYRVDLEPGGMDENQMRALAEMIGDAAAGNHFYGAVYAYRPASGGSTEIKMRSGLHSRHAAQAGALADCEAERAPGDGDCTLIGEILPEGWSEDVPELSHLAIEALRETAGQLPGGVAVARSRDGDWFEIMAGGDAGRQALDDCNARNAASGLPEDCEIVIDDLSPAP